MLVVKCRTQLSFCWGNLSCVKKIKFGSVYVTGGGVALIP